MRCPACGHLGSEVVDSRADSQHRYIRRRRRCRYCRQRFTTFEVVEKTAAQLGLDDDLAEIADLIKHLQDRRRARVRAFPFD